MQRLNALLVEINAIIDKSNDNIIITDGEGVILRASRRLVDIYRKEANYLIVLLTI